MDGGCAGGFAARTPPAPQVIEMIRLHSTNLIERRKYIYAPTEPAWFEKAQTDARQAFAGILKAEGFIR